MLGHVGQNPTKISATFPKKNAHTQNKKNKKKKKDCDFKIY